MDRRQRKWPRQRHLRCNPFQAGSAVVASNIDANIEATDSEEHGVLLEALKHKQPVVVIEPPTRKEDPAEAPVDETHPDYYISGRRRIIGITTPLIAGGHEFGSINVKSSLASVDENFGSSSRSYISQLSRLAL